MMILQVHVVVFQGRAVPHPSEEALDSAAEDGAGHGVVQPAETDHALEEGKCHAAFRIRRARTDDKVGQNHVEIYLNQNPRGGYKRTKLGKLIMAFGCAPFSVILVSLYRELILEPSQVLPSQWDL